MATLGPVTDLAGKLDQKLNALVAAKAAGATLPPPREPEPAEPADTATTTQEDVEPAVAAPVPAEPASPPESTSAPEPAVAAPAIPESTSAVQPAPASEAPTTSAIATLSKRGLKFEDEKTAAEYLRVESELARRVKAEKSTAQPEPAAAPPAKPEHAPATPKAQLRETRPEPPAEPVELTSEAQQEAERLVQSDPTCRALARQFAQVEKVLPTLITYDDAGNVVGGRAAEILREIAELERSLAPPPEALKKRGIEVPLLGDFERQQIENDITKLEREMSRVEKEYARQDNTRKRISEQFVQREEALQAPLRESVLSSRAEAEKEARIESAAQVLLDAWPGAEAAALTRNGVSEKDAPGVREYLRMAGQAHIGEIDLEPKALAEFLDRHTKSALRMMGTHAETVVRSQTEQKAASISTLRPGGQEPPAVASTGPANSADLVERLRQKRHALTAQPRS